MLLRAAESLQDVAPVEKILKLAAISTLQESWHFYWQTSYSNRLFRCALQSWKPNCSGRLPAKLLLVFCRCTAATAQQQTKSIRIVISRVG
jgi:hypothetical protein